MKQLLIASALAVSSVQAFAQPATDWTGFYIGANVGAQLATHGGSIVGTPTFAAQTFATEATTSAQLATGRIPGREAALTGGGQIGYNFMAYPSILVGVEADIQAIGKGGGRLDGPRTGIPVLFSNELITSETNAPSNPSYVGTVRGRLGYLITPDILAFATGGYAYGTGVSRGSVSQVDANGLPAGTFGAPYTATFRPRTMNGYALGGGLEWMFAPGWSIRAEYLHYDLGAGRNQTTLTNLFTSNLSFGTIGTPVTSVLLRTRNRVDGEIVRLGLNYRFNLF